MGFFKQTKEKLEDFLYLEEELKAWFSNGLIISLNKSVSNVNPTESTYQTTKITLQKDVT